MRRTRLSRWPPPVLGYGGCRSPVPAALAAAEEEVEEEEVEEEGDAMLLVWVGGE